MNNRLRNGTMKPNQRRPRSRGNGKRHTGRTHSFESSGPDGKIRGTAQQVFDKYQALGRDAQSSGDRVAAEGFLQHAEHYFRIIAAEPRPNGNARTGNEQGQKPAADAADASDAADAPDAVAVPISEAKDDAPKKKIAETQAQA